ncbi:MAG: hypothetical protein LUH08_04570, partial [Ruminococcus sp.]|nr:hypothetical protein [Ruminococcus sp.]
MSEKFKDSGEIDEIIAEVNKLKEEKERALNGKSAESAVNSIVEKNNLSEGESDKSQMADMIASSLNDKHSDTASESEEKKKPEEKKEEPEAEEDKAPKKQKKKKKKKKTAVLFVLGLLIILLGGAYIIGLMMTNDKFLPNTYINGVNVSGMTAEQAVETIEELGNQLDKIVFLKNDGSSVTIPYERFGYEFNT